MIKRQMSRRDFLRVSAMATGALALAACAPAGAPAGGGGETAASEPGVIQWWFGWGNLEPAVKTIMEREDFQDHIGGQTLEIKAGSISEPLLAALAAGEPPDGGSNIDYPGMWTRGVVIPVNDLIEGSDLINSDDVGSIYIMLSS